MSTQEAVVETAPADPHPVYPPPSKKQRKRAAKAAAQPEPIEVVSEPIEPEEDVYTPTPFVIEEGYSGWTLFRAITSAFAAGAMGMGLLVGYLRAREIQQAQAALQSEIISLAEAREAQARAAAGQSSPQQPSANV